MPFDVTAATPRGEVVDDVEGTHPDVNAALDAMLAEEISVVPDPATDSGSASQPSASSPSSPAATRGRRSPPSQAKAGARMTAGVPVLRASDPPNLHADQLVERDGELVPAPPVKGAAEAIRRAAERKRDDDDAGRDDG